MDDFEKDPLWIGKTLGGSAEFTDSQALIFEIMDECRCVSDLIKYSHLIKKRDLVYAFMSYEARICFKANPFDVFKLLVSSNPPHSKHIEKIWGEIAEYYDERRSEQAEAQAKEMAKQLSKEVKAAVFKTAKNKTAE